MKKGSEELGGTELLPYIRTHTPNETHYSTKLSEFEFRNTYHFLLFDQNGHKVPESTKIEKHFKRDSFVKKLKLDNGGAAGNYFNIPQRMFLSFFPSFYFLF